MADEGLTWAGVDVASWAIRARDLSGLLSIPGRRGANVPVAGRDGTVRQPRKAYDEREFVIEYLIRGADADGLVPDAHLDAAAARQFYRNLDLLSQLIVQDVAPMVHTLPDGTQRRLDVEVINGVEPERYLAGMLATVKIAYVAAAPWWRSLTPTVVAFSLANGGTRKLVEFAPSTGRIDDVLVTFGGAGSGNNPTLTQVETGLALGYDDTFTTGKSMRLGDFDWLPAGGLTFARTKLRTDPRIGTWWVLDPVPGDAPTVRLNLTGGGPMPLTISARQSWAVG